MIIPICINLLLGFINKAKHLFALMSPPKPFKDATMLECGSNFLILISSSYIFIKMPELGLNLNLPQLDLSSLLDNIFALMVL